MGSTTFKEVYSKKEKIFPTALYMFFYPENEHKEGKFHGPIGHFI